MISKGRIELHAPSEWDIVLSPELAPLFVLDAAIVAAQRLFSITLDPTSSSFGGAAHPLTHDLLEVICTLRVRISQYRHLVAFEPGLTDAMDLGQDCLSRNDPAP